MHGSEATVIPEWMDGWMNGWGPEGEKEWMLPAFLPKRTQLWPCIIYLLTQVTNITTGFQVHTLFIQTSHSLVDLGRTETSHICLGKGFCWPLSAVFLSCGAPHPYSCPDLEQMTYTTLLLGLCLSQTSHLPYTTNLWDHRSSFPIEHEDRETMTNWSLKCFKVCRRPSTSNRTRTQASCLQVHNHFPAHTASLSTEKGFYSLFRAVCNQCDKNPNLNCITELLPNPI